MLKSVTIENFKAFDQPQTLRFGPGINVIVGANNAGKSAVLEALRGMERGTPHTSIRTVGTPDTKPPTNSLIDYGWEVDRDTFFRIMKNANVQSFELPAPAGMRPPQIGRFAGEVSDCKKWFVSYRKQASAGANASAAPIPDHDIVKALDSQSDAPTQSIPLTINEKGDSFGLQQGASGNQLKRQLQQVSDILGQRVFHLDAERVSIAKSSTQSLTDNLQPDCRNLPGLVNALWSGAHELAENMRHYVRSILPEVVDISAPPSGQNQGVELKVRFVDDASRYDLDFPIDQCGTGTPQVVAIAYIIAVMNTPRTIIIDEPQTFLHPGAMSALLALMRTAGSMHQWILTTHSPTIISSAQPDEVILIERGSHDAPGSTVQQFNGDQAVRARELLHTTGTRLSDVFGHDFVVWVEGQTEEDALPDIAEALGVTHAARGAFVPVHSTGELDAQRRKRKEAAIRMYKTISESKGLIPPAWGFLLDDDGRTPDAKKELTKLAPGRVSFLPRRMFENYLLDAPTAHALAVLDGYEGSIEDVQEAFDLVRSSGRHVAAEHRGDDAAWTANCHGFKVLQEVYAELLPEGPEWGKTSHSVRAARWRVIHDPDAFHDFKVALERLVTST